MLSYPKVTDARELLGSLLVETKIDLASQMTGYHPAEIMFTKNYQMLYNVHLRICRREKSHSQEPGSAHPSYCLLFTPASCKENACFLFPNPWLSI